MRMRDKSMARFALRLAYLSVVIMTSFLLVVLSLHHLARCCYSGPPNIVILLADDLGWGDLSVYGHPTSTTPNLDKMASEGLMLTQFYSASSVCSPSRAALLTGRYQTRSGIYPSVLWPNSLGGRDVAKLILVSIEPKSSVVAKYLVRKGLPLNETTIAEGLKSAGYYSAIIGKWHLGFGENGQYLPVHQGFDRYYGIPYSQDMCPCPVCFYPDQSCYISCLNDVVGCPVFSNDVIVQQPADFLNLTSAYVANAIDVINRANAQSTPFFLYMAFQHTHRPQFAGEKWTNSSIRGPYGDSLNELDWAVGEIFQALKDAKIEDDTFVFFTSDNGPTLAEIRVGNAGPLRCGKGSTWEGGMREPAIAWWPGKISPGKTQELAATVDIFPTLMNLVGVELPENVTLDGVDMSPILFDNKPSKRDFYMYYPKDPSQNDGLFAVRWRQYKAHFIAKGGNCEFTYPDVVCRGNYTKQVLDPPLLYDLHQDPGEMFPLDTDDPEYADILKHITEMKMEFDANMAWGVSEVDKGTSNTVLPCAKPGCSHFPTCCTTEG